MKLVLLFIFLLSLSSCGKPKTVLICGDHICVNKSEAEQYFQENLSIEVKIIDKKKEKKLNLVELNLKENQKGKKEVKIFSKNKTAKKLKVLTKNEKSSIKKKIKKKKKREKIVNKEKSLAKKIKENKKSELTENIKKDKNINNISLKKEVNNDISNTVDVCSILEKCNINEISKYLIKNGIKKDYPDISLKQ